MARIPKNFIAIASLAGVLSLGVFLLARPGDELGSLRDAFSPFAPAEHAPLARYARAVMAACAAKPFPPACYDEEIPKLTDEISMEDAFEVIKIIQANDPRYLYCHVVSHKLSDREVEKNPAGWKEVITRCPMTFCNNGCLHGALIQRFNSESLTEKQIAEVLPDLKDVCEPRGAWNPVEVERSMCYHALGHLVMYMTGANIARSVGLCKDIGAKSDGRSYVQTCTEGVFMQIFQPLEPEDFALVKNLTPTKEKAAEFCAPYRSYADAGLAWNACRREAWPLFRKEILTPEGLVNFCSYADNPTWHMNCFASVLNIVVIELVVERGGGKIEKQVEFCDALPPGMPRETCFAHTGRQLLQLDPREYEDRALAICREAETRGIGKVCYEELIRLTRWSFPAGSEDLKRRCRNLPTPWDAKCLEP